MGWVLSELDKLNLHKQVRRTKRRDNVADGACLESVNSRLGLLFLV